MPSIYRDCDPSVHAMLDNLIAIHRSDLVKVEPNFKLLFVEAEGDGPALMHRGQQVLGRCKVHSRTDRARGTADVTIELDAAWWERAQEIRRRALLHHELTHVGCTPGKLDLDGRPKLHTVRGDWDGDGFAALAKLYGEDSIERRWLRGIERLLDQSELPLGDPADEDEGEGDTEDEDEGDTEDEDVEVEASVTINHSGSGESVTVPLGTLKEIADRIRQEA